MWANTFLNGLLNVGKLVLTCLFRSGFTRKRKDSRLLGVAARSNGLAFSHHHFLSASTSPSNHSHCYILSQVDGNAPARPRERTVPSLQPVDEHLKHDVIVPRQAVRSLIPPLSPVRTRTEPNTIRRRRNSSSSASIKSFTSSMLKKRTSIMARAPTLTTMPSELLDAIFRYLSQYELHAIMLTNSNFVELAVIRLYYYPQFASTYRFAQFTHTIINHPQYRPLVRTLDISHFIELPSGSPTPEIPCRAGWREFKYRHQEMYYAFGRKTSLSASQNHKNLICSPDTTATRTHPPPSPMLESFQRTRDVPIGGIIHVLSRCTRLRKINFSRLQLASDFIIMPSGQPQKLPHPTSLSPISTQMYISDTAAHINWENNELVGLYADEVIYWLCKLEELESFKARETTWLTTKRVREIVDRAGRKLERVDFRGGGMVSGVRWAVKGKRREVGEVVREFMRNTGMEEGGEEVRGWF